MKHVHAKSEMAAGTGVSRGDSAVPMTTYSRGYAIARCQAKTTRQSYWHELRDHQEYSKKIAMKTGIWVYPSTCPRD